MTEMNAHRALDSALLNDTDELYYEGQLSPTKAGEYLMDDRGCPDEEAFEYAFTWVEKKENARH